LHDSSLPPASTIDAALAGLSLAIEHEAVDVELGQSLCRWGERVRLDLAFAGGALCHDRHVRALCDHDLPLLQPAQHLGAIFLRVHYHRRLREYWLLGGAAARSGTGS
jgi:hypothetical protein